MSCQNVISLIFSGVTVFAAVCSVVIATKTLKQTSKRLENSTRPYIVAYGRNIRLDERTYFYLVVKNFGTSAAFVDSFHISESLEYGVNSDEDFIQRLNGAVIVPNQSHSCYLRNDSVPETLTIDLKYHAVSLKSKSYVERFEFNPKAGINMLQNNFVSNENALYRIAAFMQELWRMKL